MLDQAISIRTNKLWTSWADRLADQADRTRAELIRDVVYLMIFDDDLGQAICQHLITDQISYNK